MSMNPDRNRAGVLLVCLICLPGVVLLAFWLLPFGPAFEGAWIAFTLPSFLIQGPDGGIDARGAAVLLLVLCLTGYLSLRFLHAASALLAVAACLVWYFVVLVAGVSTAPSWHAPDLYWGHTFAGYSVIPAAALISLFILLLAYRAARSLLRDP